MFQTKPVQHILTSFRAPIKRIRLAASILLNGNLPKQAFFDTNAHPAYFSEPFPSNRCMLTNACEVSSFYDIARKHLQDKGVLSGRMAEIGGSISGNAKSIFSNFEYINIDLENNDNVPTLCLDICDQSHELEPNQFDFILSQWVFEHLTEPWTAAKQIIRLLKPGGIVMNVTVFAWRYHPVPIDYWRFSPEALVYLFKDLVNLEAGFVSTFRRSNDRGAYPNLSDAVPLDEYGGWLESWAVYHVAYKEPK
ncbi:MAG: methyltransferase domain-containing protein [Candidatus Methanoperedens sp.]|nr:methyltransferase domain-containing protein [Candidatus Methanoperedens sp.]